MRILGRVVMISGGVFLGGGIGFYLKETYYVRIKKERCHKLRQELKELSDIRKEKEKKVNDIKQSDKG